MDGLFIASSGEVMVTAAGEALVTNGEECPECGCGGEATWPATGWIVCAPCPGEPETSKPVVANAATVRAALIAIFGSIEAITMTCVVGTMYDPALGRSVCVSCSPSSGTIASASDAAYLKNPTFPSLNVTAPNFTCCDCSAGCRGDYHSETPPEGPSITYSSRRVRASQNPTIPAAYQYHCCCPRIGANGITMTSAGSMKYSYDGRNFAEEGQTSWNLVFTGEHQDLYAPTTVKYTDKTTGKVTTVQGSVRMNFTGCGSFCASAWAGDPYIRTAAFGGGNIPNYNDPNTVSSGSASVGCGALSFNLTKQSPFYGITYKIEGNETVTYSGASVCGGGCGQDENTTSASACAKIIVDGYGADYPPAVFTPPSVLPLVEPTDDPILAGGFLLP